ncbi:MAG: hypothetical protein WC091_13930, partial [Sulfuricellaceae bacterium]
RENSLTSACSINASVYVDFIIAYTLKRLNSEATTSLTQGVPDSLTALVLKRVWDHSNGGMGAQKGHIAPIHSAYQRFHSAQ